MFCANPHLYPDDDAEDNVNDTIVRQAEGARAGGRMLCSLERYETSSYLFRIVRTSLIPEHFDSIRLDSFCLRVDV